MERHWLIRTQSNQILGPLRKEELAKLIENNDVSGEDEICQGNGYWFFIKEKELLENYFYQEQKQSFNPVSEAVDSVSSSVVAKEELNRFNEIERNNQTVDPIKDKNSLTEDLQSLERRQNKEIENLYIDSDDPKYPSQNDLTLPGETETLEEDENDITIMGSLLDSKLSLETGNQSDSQEQDPLEVGGSELAPPAEDASEKHEVAQDEAEINIDVKKIVHQAAQRPLGSDPRLTPFLSPANTPKSKTFGALFILLIFLLIYFVLKLLGIVPPLKTLLNEAMAQPVSQNVKKKVFFD